MVYIPVNTWTRQTYKDAMIKAWPIRLFLAYYLEWKFTAIKASIVCSSLLELCEYLGGVFECDSFRHLFNFINYLRWIEVLLKGETIRKQQPIWLQVSLKTWLKLLTNQAEKI